MASNWRSMAEKKESNNGKVSYFLNISIKSKGMMTHEQPQPTVRIKIPKLLVKTVHQKKKKKKMKEHRNSDYDDDDDDDNDNDDNDDNDDDDGANANRNRSLVKFSNPANKFIKDKVTSLFSNVVSKFKNSASSSTCSRCNRTSSSFIGRNRNREIKEQVCTACSVLKKIRSIGSARKEIFPGKRSRKKIKTDEEEGEELCKRKILMGERCRPENELSE